MSRIRSRLFSQDQITWLRKKYNTMLIVDLVSKMNDRYKTNFTDKQVYQFCRAHWGNSVFNAKPNSGRFTKGHEPWHKGTRGTGAHKGNIRTRRTAQEYFDGFTAKDGEKRVDINGVTFIKTKSEWMAYHRYVYEQHHGVTLTSDDMILFRDGDKSNFDIGNFIRVDRSTNSSMIGNDLHQYKGELIESAVLLARLNMGIKGNLK